MIREIASLEPYPEPSELITTRGWATEINQFPNRDRSMASPHASPQQPMGHVFLQGQATKNLSAAPLPATIAQPVSTATGGPPA